MTGFIRSMLAATALAGPVAVPAQIVAPSAAAPAASPVEKSANTSDIGEIIVSASRRDESVRRTPTAVSAYSGDRLREAQLVSLNDLVATSPNIQLSTSAINANVSIRGIGNTQTQAGADPGVAVHFDGAYLAQSYLAQATFLDVARVEILRGPQGTLFGRNATGGAVNFVPNTPTRELGYGFDIAVGGDPAAVRSSAYVTGSLDSAGALRGRISVQQNYNEGYTRNLSPDGPGRLDGTNNYSARGQLEWSATSNITARLLVEYQKQSDNGPANYLLGTPSIKPLPPLIINGPVGTPDTRQDYANVGSRDLDAKTAILHVDWVLGGGALKALASYNESNVFVFYDGDGTPANFTTTSYNNRAHQYYGELLYASDASKPLNYVVGANYFNDHLSQTATTAIAGFVKPVSLGGVIGTESYAVFAHAQYEFLRDTKAFAGVRYTHDAKHIDEFNNYVGTKSQQDAWGRVTYEVGVSHEFSDQLDSYLKYATGYKSGGFSAGGLAAPFNPETNANLEAGLKGSFLHRHLQANLAVFHMNYSDLQVNQVIGVLASVTNAAKAKIDGVELELSARPADGIRLELSGAYLNARFDQFVTQDSARPQLGLLNLAGNQLPQAPHFTTSAGAYYDLPFVTSGTLTAGARFDWKSRLAFNQFNIPIAEQGPAGKLDLTLRYRSESSRWSASIYALNATDRQVKSYENVVSALLGSLALARYQPGRQVGASVGYHF